MPKLLQINVCCNVYSTGKICEQIGLSAKKAGWDSYIAYARGFKPSQSTTIKVGRKLDVYLHYALQRIFDIEGLASRRATKKLVKEIDTIKPDIVQIHNIHDHYLNYKILFEYLNSSDIKVVWTFHDCWAFTGHCFHFVTKQCDRWRTGCYDCPLKDEYPETFLDRSVENYALKRHLFSGSPNLTIVPCSDWMDTFVKQSFLKEKKTFVIKNGVDLQTFKPVTTQESQLTKEDYNIIAVSTVWNKEKGYDDVLKLRSILPPNYIITLVGLTQEQKDSLPDGIIGIQRTQNAHELVELYSNADVLINPTYADTFPTVNLEALACGTPVITYNTGGSPESIDEFTGIVVQQGNVNDLAVAIQRLHTCPLSRRDCRSRAETLFDKEKCFDKYIELYNRILSE